MPTVPTEPHAVVCTRPDTRSTLLHLSGAATGFIAIYSPVPEQAPWGRASFLTYWLGALTLIFFSLSLLIDLGLRRFHRRGKAPLLTAPDGRMLVEDILIERNVVQVPGDHRLAPWVRRRDAFFYTLAPLAWLVGFTYLLLDLPLNARYYAAHDWFFTVFQHILPIFLFGSEGTRIHHALRYGSRDLVRTPALVAVYWMSNLIGGWVSGGWFPYALQEQLPIWAMVPAVLVFVLLALYLSAYQGLYVWPLLWEVRSALLEHESMDHANGIMFYPAPPGCPTVCCPAFDGTGAGPVAGTSSPKAAGAGAGAGAQTAAPGARPAAENGAGVGGGGGAGPVAGPRQKKEKKEELVGTRI